MSAAPEEILASLRRLRARAQGQARAGLLQDAMATMAASGFEVARCAERDDVLGKIAEIVPPGASVVSHPSVVGRALGLNETLRAQGRTVVALPADGEPRGADGPAGSWRERFLAAQFGITGATALVADTGSVVLAEESGFGRAASNVPPVHITLATADSVVATLLDAATIARGYAALHLGRPVPRYLSLISGPSKTADIAMTLVRGMHGPRIAHVLIWDGPKAEGTDDEALRTWVLA